ncbi:MAG: M18 family aminopeptidase [Spirochaetales bacterium]|nr:M18 family aminopeptidase [Spirochaetales bacterium]
MSRNEIFTTQESLGKFIDSSPTMYQAEGNISSLLQQAGAIPLAEDKSWKIEPGNTYWISRENSSLIAFRMGESPVTEGGLRVAGAHTDSPMLKVKPNSQTREKGYYLVSTEVYGGPILSTWIDRELVLAGVAKVRKSGKTTVVSFSIESPVGIIPNLAIHLNRDVNKGFEYNAQDHLRVLLFTDVPESYGKQPLEYLISKEISEDPNSIVGGDWFFSPFQGSTLVKDSIGTIFAPRIDNLAGCHSVLRGFLQAVPGDTTQIAVFYNHEEIGSGSIQGANSQFFFHTVQRLIGYQNITPEDFYITLARSMQISVDAAHSVHPNFSGKFDPAYQPELGKGPVIKQSASQRYATNPRTEGVVEDLSLLEDIPLQYTVNRSDIPSGTTIGPLSATRSDIPTVDIGIPIFAMHSTRETACAYDQYHSIRLLQHFFEATYLGNERN